MKRYVLPLLFLFVISGLTVVTAAEYGQPYGATDETPMEATAVKSINDVNNAIESPEIENEETPIEQENETPMEATDGATPYKE